MPRRRPNAVRAAQQRAGHHAIIPGLSPSTCHALNRLDRAELRPDVVYAALRQWQRVAKDPGAHQYPVPKATGPELADLLESRTEPMCPVCERAHARVYEPQARDVLRSAIHALPRGKARQLRALVHRADRRVLAATLPNPDRPPDDPWWYRRLVLLR